MATSSPQAAGRSRGLLQPSRRGISGTAIAGFLGAAWGLASYLVLWGYTSIQVTRSFVDSPRGLLLLMPARLVLWGVHLAESRIARSPFDFSRNHAWIGILSTMAGAALVLLPLLLFRAARAFRRRRR